MNFIAVDVETANARMRSICQIGVVKIQGGNEVFSRRYLVNPEEEFDPFNTAIHGIDAQSVSSAPSFADVFGQLLEVFNGQIIACHTHFDRVAVSQACQHHGIGDADCTWLDTAKVARRAWSRFAHSGYGLANLAKEFGLSFNHHDALDDARMAAAILVRACKETETSAAEWVARCRKGLSGESDRIVRSGSGDGPLQGEVLVFTGSLRLSRREAADLADLAGARVDGGVTKATTVLVAGDQDMIRLAGAEKSSKQRKAETLAEQGQAIRFLAESDFLALVT